MRLKVIFWSIYFSLGIGYVEAQEFRSEKKFIQLNSNTNLPLHERVAKESKYYGLIIGVNNYNDPEIISLDNSINDAQRLQEVLTREYNFENENILLLEDPKREDIIDALDYLAWKVTPYDNLLIFFAGHSWWDEETNIGYWLPADARRFSKADWFRNSTLVDYLKEVNTRHSLLITGAYFGGSVFKTSLEFDDNPKAIEMLYELTSRQAITSGTQSEKPDQSSFINDLIGGLEKNTNRYLSSEQLYSKLRTAMVNKSEVIPQFGEILNVGDLGGDFIFFKR